jgi:hypothetical protein
MEYRVSDVVVVVILALAFVLGEWRIHTGEHDDAASFSTENCHNCSLQNAEAR